MTTQSSSRQHASINSVRNYQIFLPPRDLLRQMFEDESGDWEMIATDGKSFKFHQTVLNQVHRFRTLFSHPTTVECMRKQVVVPEEVNMCGASVEAFLRYFYYKDTLGMEKSFSVTCALIRAGHYYNILNLVEDAVVVLRAIRFVADWQHAQGEVLKWFNVPELWELYLHLWHWEEEHPSKRKLMRIIGHVLKVFSQYTKQREMMISIASKNPMFSNLLLGLVVPVGRYSSPIIARNTTSGQDPLAQFKSIASINQMILASFPQFVPIRRN